KNKFPQPERPRVFEFPAALMKEGAPEEQFHNQEERRLFYVALTRAENRLTITTLTEKKGKIPVFIEDLLMDPAIKRRDIHQMKPKLPEARPIAEKLFLFALEPQLFPVSAGPPKIF